MRIEPVSPEATVHIEGNRIVLSEGQFIVVDNEASAYMTIEGNTFTEEEE